MIIDTLSVPQVGKYVTSFNGLANTIILHFKITDLKDTLFSKSLYTFMKKSIVPLLKSCNIHTQIVNFENKDKREQYMNLKEIYTEAINELNKLRLTYTNPISMETADAISKLYTYRFRLCLLRYEDEQATTQSSKFKQAIQKYVLSSRYLFLPYTTPVITDGVYTIPVFSGKGFVDLKDVELEVTRDVKKLIYTVEDVLNSSPLLLCIGKGLTPSSHWSKKVKEDMQSKGYSYDRWMDIASLVWVWDKGSALTYHKLEELGLPGYLINHLQLVNLTSKSVNVSDIIYH